MWHILADATDRYQAASNYMKNQTLSADKIIVICVIAAVIAGFAAYGLFKGKK